MRKKSSDKNTLHNSVAIIGTVGIPANYGGFETFVENLTRELGRQIPLTVFCSSKSYSTRLKKHNDAKLQYIPLHANGYQSVPYDIISLFLAARKHDTILILGASGCLILPLFRLFYPHKRLVANLDGLEHKREKWNGFIRYFLKLSEKTAMRHTNEIIADNKVIQQYYQDEYGKESTLITYGGDQVGNLPLSPEVRLKYGMPLQYAFSVCRIEPENNTHLILEAFSKSTVPLIFMGNWDYSDYGRKLRDEYGRYGNIILLGPEYDLRILDQLRSNCNIYIHGHSAGGTNPSLVEAMNLDLPVFAFDVEFNREATFRQAKYFKTPQHLLSLLSDSSEEELKAMGHTLGLIARENYRWLIIAEKYAELLSGPVI